PMTSLKTSIKTITYLSDTGCLEIQGASLPPLMSGRKTPYVSALFFLRNRHPCWNKASSYIDSML
ncbi:hypothetical protein DP331_21840, partial [Shigella flexneri]|nr:hypothetical protein [Shigella flexneri]